MFDSCFEVGSQTLLHCHERLVDERRGLRLEFELVAFMVSSTFFDGSVDWAVVMKEHSVHELPQQIHEASILVPITEPAVYRFVPAPRVGGDITPSQPTRQLIQATSLEDADFESVVWRDGRRLDSCGPGPSLSHGCALLVRTQKLPSISTFDLVWAVFQDGRPLALVHPAAKKVY